MDVARKLQDEIFLFASSQLGNFIFEHCHEESTEICDPLFCGRNKTKSTTRGSRVVPAPASTSFVIPNLLIPNLLTFVWIGGLAFTSIKGNNEVTLQIKPQEIDNNKFSSDVLSPLAGLKGASSSKNVKYPKDGVLKKSKIAPVIKPSLLIQKKSRTSKIKSQIVKVSSALPTYPEAIEMKSSSKEVPRVLVRTYAEDGQKGLLRFNDERFYMGELNGLQRQGDGLELYADGTSFEGKWKDDKKNGVGTTYGMEENRLMSSEATSKDDNVSKKEKIIKLERENDGSGILYEGVPNSPGVIKYSNGVIFIGRSENKNSVVNDCLKMQFQPNGNFVFCNYAYSKLAGNVLAYKRDDKAPYLQRIDLESGKRETVQGGQKYIWTRRAFGDQLQMDSEGHVSFRVSFRAKSQVSHRNLPNGSYCIGGTISTKTEIRATGELLCRS